MTHSAENDALREDECICAELADMVGFRLTDDQLKRICDLHTTRLVARVIPPGRETP